MNEISIETYKQKPLAGMVAVSVVKWIPYHLLYLCMRDDKSDARGVNPEVINNTRVWGGSAQRETTWYETNPEVKIHWKMCATQEAAAVCGVVYP